MIKVLYVDDEPSLLDICREFIQVPGQITMDTALSVHEAEAAMARVEYEVIVSDYQMPGTSGIDFLKKLRSRSRYVPFILFTGRGREEVAIEALNCGADFYLQKGGDPSVQYGQLQKAILQLAKSHLTERSLAITQRRYRDLVEDVNAIAVKLDPEMRVIYVNPYGMKQMGWGNDLVGTSFVEWLDKARVGRDEHPRHIFQAMFAQREKGETFTHSFRTREGEKRWVAWTCRFIRDEREVVEEVLLFGTDVTDAKRNEAKLQRSISLIQAAFDSSEEGILVTDPDQRVTEYNQRFLEMWGIPAGVMSADAEGSLLTHVREQVAAPDVFMSFIDDIYSHPLDEKRWTIEFTDGRKFDACTKPVMLGTEVEGRFWSFLDVTFQSLREKEFRLREENILGLLDNNKANMLIVDPRTGDIVYANKSAIEFYGYGSERLLAMRISDINTMDPKAVAEKMHSAYSEKKQYFIFQHRLASGELRDVEVFSGPIEFEGRSLLFSMVHDISEMERTKRLVGESELRHNRILNSLAVGILVTDVTGKLIYANQTVQGLLRRRPEQIIGYSPIDLVADEHKALVLRNMTLRTKGGKGVEEYRFLRGDGSPVWVQVTAVPLFDHGEYGGTIASVVDISEQRRDAEMLRESERKFREIFNNMHDAVMIHEPGGPFFEVNDLACERYGYSREEMLKIEAGGHRCSRDDPCHTGEDQTIGGEWIGHLRVHKRHEGREEDPLGNKCHRDRLQWQTGDTGRLQGHHRAQERGIEAGTGERETEDTEQHHPARHNEPAHGPAGQPGAGQIGRRRPRHGGAIAQDRTFRRHHQFPAPVRQGLPGDGDRLAPVAEHRPAGPGTARRQGDPGTGGGRQAGAPAGVRRPDAGQGLPQHHGGHGQVRRQTHQRKDLAPDERPIAGADLRGPRTGHTGGGEAEDLRDGVREGHRSRPAPFFGNIVHNRHRDQGDGRTRPRCQVRDGSARGQVPVRPGLIASCCSRKFRS